MLQAAFFQHLARSLIVAVYSTCNLRQLQRSKTIFQRSFGRFCSISFSPKSGQKAVAHIIVIAAPVDLFADQLQSAPTNKATVLLFDDNPSAYTVVLILLTDMRDGRTRLLNRLYRMIAQKAVYQRVCIKDEHILYVAVPKFPQPQAGCFYVKGHTHNELDAR